MGISEVSEKTKDSFICPTKEIESFYSYTIDLLNRCETELEFIARQEEAIDRFNGYIAYSSFNTIENEIGTIVPNKPLLTTIIKGVYQNHKSHTYKKEYGNITTFKGHSFVYSYHKRYEIEQHGLCLNFNITEIGEEDSEGFSFILRIMENGKDYKVVDLNPDPEKKYIGKGISISMILHAKDKFNKRIISSSNKNNQSEYYEFNSDEAIEKVWDRMLERNLVNYDQVGGFYYTI